MHADMGSSTTTGSCRLCILDMISHNDLQEPEERSEILSDIQELLAPFGEVRSVEFKEPIEVPLVYNKKDDGDSMIVLVTMDSSSSASSVVALLQGLVVGGIAVRLVQLEDETEEAFRSIPIEPSSIAMKAATNTRWMVKVAYESTADSALPVIDSLVEHCGQSPISVWSERLSYGDVLEIPISSSRSLLADNSMFGTYPLVSSALPWGVLYFGSAIEAFTVARHLSSLIVAGVQLEVYNFDLFLYLEVFKNLGIPLNLERRPHSDVFPLCDMYDVLLRLCFTNLYLLILSSVLFFVHYALIFLRALIDTVSFMNAESSVIEGNERSVYVRLRRFLCLCDISDDDERDEVRRDITDLLDATSISSKTRKLFFVLSDESSSSFDDDTDIDVYVDIGSLLECAATADA